MKCNKCGTPIIPGEKACRICGNMDFSERVKEPEIIDFPDEIEEKVEIKEEIVNELPDLMDIIDIDDEPVNNNEIEIVEEPKEEVIDFNEEAPKMPELILDEPIDFEMSKYEEPIQAQPVLDLVEEPVMEEAKEEIIEPEVKEEKPVKKEKTKKVVELDEPKSNKKKVLDKVNEKEEKPKKEPKEPKIKTKKNSSNNVGTILLTIFLLCSIGLNIFLFVNNGNSKTSGGETPENNETYSKSAYSNYKVTMPSTWITENKNGSLVIYDDTQNWSASMKLVDDASYEAFSANKEALVESLGGLRYQFTSNYSKSVEEKEFHLFKGKYYDYSVFVIVTELDEDTLVVVDLKFKGEVDDILLNNVLTAMAGVKENNTNELFKDNFEFVDITEQIKSVSKEVQTTEE